MSEEEVTKEKIFTACQERFIREGFASVSVDDIAAGLAMSKKTFYRHFSGKEDLVQQIVERFMGTIRAHIDHTLASEMSAVEKLHTVFTTIATNASRLAPVFGRDIQRRLPQLWERIEEFRRQRISEVFTRLNRQGVEEGSMRADMNGRVFLLCILAAIDRIMQPEVLVHESVSVGGAIQEIMGIFFRGALTSQGREQFEQFLHSHHHTA